MEHIDERQREHLRQWIGRTETRADRIAPVTVAALAATLDRDDPEPATGDALPPLWHWTLFVPVHRQRELGPDGHARRGGFLPPVPLPRRMWAGGRITFLRDLRVGDDVVRHSTIADVSVKDGRTGQLAFVQVRHEIGDADGIGVVEEHDIVYRAAPRPGDPLPAPQPAPAPAAWRREIRPDPVLLFRYSALTFNGHRIHYDREYVTGVEGYPGLIVHGPLMATLLVDGLRREQPGVRLSHFEFRALSPVFDTAPFHVCGAEPDAQGRVALWIEGPDGRCCMQATATLA